MDVVRIGFCGHLQLLVFFFFGKTLRPEIPVHLSGLEKQMIC